SISAIESSWIEVPGILNLLLSHNMSLLALSARVYLSSVIKGQNRGNSCKSLLLKGESDTLPIPREYIILPCNTFRTFSVQYTANPSGAFIRRSQSSRPQDYRQAAGWSQTF